MAATETAIDPQPSGQLQPSPQQRVSQPRPPHRCHRSPSGRNQRQPRQQPSLTNTSFSARSIRSAGDWAARDGVGLLMVWARCLAPEALSSPNLAWRGLAATRTSLPAPALDTVTVARRGGCCIGLVLARSSARDVDHVWRVRPTPALVSAPSTMLTSGTFFGLPFRPALYQSFVWTSRRAMSRPRRISRTTQA